MDEDRGSGCTYEPQQRPRPIAAFRTLTSELSGTSALLTCFDSNESIPSISSSLALCDQSLPPMPLLPGEPSSRICDEMEPGPSLDVSVVRKTYSPLTSPLPAAFLALCTPRETTLPLSPFLARLQQPSLPTAQRRWELSPRIYNQIGLVHSSDVSVLRSTCSTTEHIPCLAGSSFEILPSIHFQTIPRPLRVPLSPVLPEYTRVFSVAGSELDMILCVFSPISSGRVVLNRCVPAA